VGQHRWRSQLAAQAGVPLSAVQVGRPQPIATRTPARQGTRHRPRRRPAAQVGMASIARARAALRRPAAQRRRAAWGMPGLPPTRMAERAAPEFSAVEATQRPVAMLRPALQGMPHRSRMRMAERAPATASPRFRVRRRQRRQRRRRRRYQYSEVERHGECLVLCELEWRSGRRRDQRFLQQRRRRR
jgi:hypothetical protein